jgi:hypothetical protein
VDREADGRVAAERELEPSASAERIRARRRELDVRGREDRFDCGARRHDEVGEAARLGDTALRDDAIVASRVGRDGAGDREVVRARARELTAVRDVLEVLTVEPDATV